MGKISEENERLEMDMFKMKAELLKGEWAGAGEEEMDRKRNRKPQSSLT